MIVCTSHFVLQEFIRKFMGIKTNLTCLSVIFGKIFLCNGLSQLTVHIVSNIFS